MKRIGVKGGAGFLLAMGAALMMLATSPAFAHKVSAVSLVANLDTEEGTYLLDAAMAVIPSEEQALNEEITPEDAATQFAEEYLFVMFDEEEQSSDLEVTRIATSDDETPLELQQQEVIVKISGAIPDGAREFMLYLDPTCPMAVVMVVIKDDTRSRRMQVILAGEYSRPVNVQPVLEGDPFERAVKAKETTQNEVAEEPSVPAEGSKTNSILSGFVAIFTGSLLLLLLPVSVPLLTTQGWTVVYQLIAILVGQSLFASLAVWNLVPGWNAVPLLGGILALVAIEGLLLDKLKWWRLVLLLAGGACSGVLLAETTGFRSLFSGENPAIASILGFVTGSEFAVLAVAGVAAGLLHSLRGFPWYRSGVVQPLAVLLCGYGVFSVVAKLF